MYAASIEREVETMADQFDPNNILRNFEQQAKDKVDSAIEDVASKVPGGDQFAQQAKDAANQAIDQAGQQAGQQAQQQVSDKLGGMGGIGEQLGGMLGGGQDAGGQGSGSNS